jgi:MFS family permease
MIGNLSSGTLATWRERRNMPNATVATMATGALIVLPASVVTPLLPTAVLTLAGAGVYYFGIALTFGVATAALAALSPGAIRGQVVAIYLLLGNLLGLGLGPMAVGLLLDHGGPLLGQIGPSLALTSAVVALPAAFMLRRVARLPAIRERGRHALPVAEPGL